MNEDSEYIYVEGDEGEKVGERILAFELKSFNSILYTKLKLGRDPTQRMTCSCISLVICSVI